MTDSFKYEKDASNIVTVTMDMRGSVNAINDEFIEAMRSTLNKLQAEENLAGVVITSAKKTFIAGGDLNDLVAAQPGEEQGVFVRTEGIKALLRQIEKLPVPVVAAINGAALGGGLEVCLCCNHRIAVDSRAVLLGLPEVGLGLLPGGGGVVRLTSLLGFEKAFPFLIEGKKLGPAPALAAGLIHETVATQDELLPRSKAWILDNPDSAVQAWDVKGFKIPGGGEENPAIRQGIVFAAAGLQKKTRGLLPAPEMILDIMVETLRVDLDTALRIESRQFAQLVTTPEAKNMINAFFFQMNQVAGGQSRPKGFEPNTVSRLGILGGGMMGQGIAMSAAMVGINVVIKDVTMESAEKAKAYSEKGLAKLVQKGRMKEAAAAEVLARIKPSVSDSDLQGCDFIIEAVFENVELKHSLTKSTESCLAEGGVWASNTSTLPITALSTASSKPANFIGMHFFSPVDRMPLVEIICGAETSEETLAKAFDLTRQLKKTPIVVNDSPGFYTSRTISTPIQEAAQLMAEGVNAVRVESVGKSVGWPVGPLALQDEVSQKLSLDIIDAQISMGLRKAEDDPTPQGTALMRCLLNEHKRGGRVHGGGYYEYSETGKQIWPGLRDLYFKEDVDRAVSDQDIRDRLLFRPVIESLVCLETGVLRTVADGNIGSIMGIGAPTWTGGYIQFVNTYGLVRFVERCRELESKYGKRFAPPQIAIDKARLGELFQ
ncbi:3-hydroxyacyl-CoA dehydrogenase NAD-binding domain-containing protein [Zhongshania marina]|uniref:3-hydroxyacyl-CoA dehydrogenase n=1 Tax=Zhongshania marina TaxID=2304603 RepID=A0A2S4HFE1_9GAMM|nr:3-hydroxyacyl-CoA dehydrogenase NAD-binding domain-containing protein [Marortus luteolus]POP52688.1 3-hydroxyacyl-CoA dehydrogenase [Marortus luteolus]